MNELDYDVESTTHSSLWTVDWAEKTCALPGERKFRIGPIRVDYSKEIRPVPPASEADWLKVLPGEELKRATETIESELGIKITMPAAVSLECKKLVEKLNLDDYEEREKAKVVLSKIGTAALPELIRAMGSEDPHFRREATQLALPLLRAKKLLEEQAKLQDIENRDIELMKSAALMTKKELGAKRIALMKPLLEMSGEISKEEVSALSRVKSLVLAMEKELQTRKPPATEQERYGIQQCKKEIHLQQSISADLKFLMGQAVTTAVGVSAGLNDSKNGIDVKLTGALLKRAFALDVFPFDPHIQFAMRKMLHQCGKSMPADLIDAYKKAGGAMSTLEDSEFGWPREV